MSHDPSNGYECVAADYMAARSSTGISVIEKWATSLPENASVLDVGAGHGFPLAPVFIQAGLKLSAIDASPSLVAAFRESFPHVRIVCEAVEDSKFYGETFDAITAIGLMFLLPEETQERLISRVSAALKPKGRFLFSAPMQKCDWADVLTGKISYGLGVDAYEVMLNRCGFDLVSTCTDSGDNHYYNAEKREI